MIRETSAGLGEVVHSRAGGPVVAVGAQVVGAQRVDQDEEEVEVLALRQRSDVLPRAHIARVAVDLDLGGRVDGSQHQDPDDRKTTGFQPMHGALQAGLGWGCGLAVGEASAGDCA